MKVVSPVEIALPRTGLRFAESVHAPGFAMPLRVDGFHKLLLLVAGEVEYRRPGFPSVRGRNGDVVSGAVTSPLRFTTKTRRHKGFDPRTVFIAA